ncbi:DUF4153 domain-containing protein [Paramixta manurensis]|uniref:DUF4153 domain-containing protein n=1 Tax=Paramixta manurensis TaxID=2740817 RepID=A0A6M8U4F3_9GAMM|nr:DUF4153 domain-containing protein [Erwiniaceae bacterium PD-1]
MLLPSVLPSTTRWGILFIGLLTGALWAALLQLPTGAACVVYPLVLASGFTSVLAFTVTRFLTAAPWLLALSVTPFLALITGWLRWNFAGQHADEFPVELVSIIFFWLFLLMPFLQARALNERGVSPVIASLWRNTFTVAATALLTGLFWLILLFWSRLFALIEIRWFEWLFFDNAIFPPIASGLAIAAGIVLCRGLPAASEVFRRFVTLLASAVLPLHAAISLLFLAFLPFTGLTIIPHSVSATFLLSAMALVMMVMSAVVSSPGARALNYPGWLNNMVMLAQLLTPLFALLAAYALWLRVAQYGWTPERIDAAVVVVIALLWSFGVAWLRCRRAAARIDALSVVILGLMALLWLLLHSPAIDPYRITVKQQLARFEAGAARADGGDLYLFSRAGRRGHQALLALQAHPQWLEDPQLTRGMLAQLLSGNDRLNPPDLDGATLRQRITLRADSPPPPESWWQSISGDNSYLVRTCVVASSSCMAWAMDLNNDGQVEVLLYDRDQHAVHIFTQQHDQWRQIGQITPDNDGAGFDRAIRHGPLSTVEKPWRDVQLNGRRYPVQYYGVD